MSELGPACAACSDGRPCIDHGTPSEQVLAALTNRVSRLEDLRPRTIALETRLGADHGISPAQLHEKVEALELSIGTAHNEAASDRAIVLSLEKRLDAALKRIEQQDKTIALLLDRVNQLVEFHGIRPIGEES